MRSALYRKHNIQRVTSSRSGVVGVWTKVLGLVRYSDLLWVDDVMRSMLYTKHDIGNQPTVVGAEPNDLCLGWYVQLGASRATGSFDGSLFSLCFAENLPPLSCLLFLLSNLLTSEFSAVKGMINKHFLKQPKCLYVSINKCKILNELMREDSILLQLKYWNCGMHRCMKIHGTHVVV